MRFANLILLLLCSLASQAQFRFAGIVKDAQTQKAIPFATVSFLNQAIITDVDGSFAVESIDFPDQITISYVGYELAKLDYLAKKNYYNIRLKEKADKDIIWRNATFDAAWLVQQVITTKNRNDPQQVLPSFQFKSYNKIILSADADSLKGAVDTIYKRRFWRDKIKLDSSDYKFKKLISRHHLFLTEKVSRFDYDGQRVRETIIGSKMAGFSKPIYELFTYNLQSFSIYDSKYELFSTTYRSPIDYEAFKGYRFRVLDSINIMGRKTVLVYFKNKLKSRSAGLEGVLYIDFENYAIAKAVMRIRGVLDISGTHEFRFFPKEQLWFPVRKEFRIVKGTNNKNIKILGSTIIFDGASDLGVGRSRKYASDFAYLSSVSNNFGIAFNKSNPIEHPFIKTEVQREAAERDSSFWKSYRIDPHDFRSRNTYGALDSIVTSKKLEQRVRIGRKLLNGYVPFGAVDLDLRSLISFNNHEGIRLGIGGRTSERLSTKYRLESYVAFGTKDGTIKYSVSPAIRIGNFTDSWIGASYTDDIREVASTTFAIDKREFKIYDARPINISTFYKHTTYRAFFETKFIPKTESIWQITHSNVAPLFNYLFNNDGKLYDNYVLLDAVSSIQWNPYSDYMQTPSGRIEAEKRFPKLTIQFTKSLPKEWGSDFNYAKIDLRTEYEKKFLNGHKTSLLLEAGTAIGDLPLTHLYNTSPNSLTKETIVSRITLAGKNSFETMYFNEFFSSEYALLQLKHSFGNIKIIDAISPELVLVNRAAFGDLKHPEKNIGATYKTLDKGYYETGAQLNQILSVFGVGGFYRYGPSHLPRFQDNIAVKVTFVLNFI